MVDKMSLICTNIGLRSELFVDVDLVSVKLMVLIIYFIRRMNNLSTNRTKQMINVSEGGDFVIEYMLSRSFT